MLLQEVNSSRNLKGNQASGDQDSGEWKGSAPNSLHKFWQRTVVRETISTFLGNHFSFKLAGLTIWNILLSFTFVPTADRLTAKMSSA